MKRVGQHHSKRTSPRGPCEAPHARERVAGGLFCQGVAWTGVCAEGGGTSCVSGSSTFIHRDGRVRHPCPSHCEIVGGMVRICVPCHVIHLHACTGDQRRTLVLVPNTVALTWRDDFAHDTQSVSNGARRLAGAAPRGVEGRRPPKGAAGSGRLRCRYFCVSGPARLVRRRPSQALSLPKLVSKAVRSMSLGARDWRTPACPLQASHCRRPQY